MRRLGQIIENAIVDRQEKYMRLRIEQLKEDRDKAHDEHDKAWYNRIIQELDWAMQMKGKPDHNCYMKMRDEHNRLMEEKVGATGGREIWT